MLLEKDKQDQGMENFKELYYSDFNRWLSYGRKQGLSEEAVLDLIQELSLKMLSVSTRLADMNEERLKAYTMATYKNLIADEQKRKKIISLEEALVKETSDVEEIVLDKLEYEELKSAVQTLTASQQKLIFLKYYLNFSYQEIGEEMGMKDNAVRVQKHRIILLLQKLLSGKIKQKGGRRNGVSSGN